MYKVVQTARLYEQIVQQIQDSVTSGTLKEGDQLPAERLLALQFGVSRTAVREAVKALREKGLVEAYPGRGTFITSGTARSIQHTLDRMIRDGTTESTLHLVEVREILEPEIAALAEAIAFALEVRMPSNVPSSEVLPIGVLVPANWSMVRPPRIE